MRGLRFRFAALAVGLLAIVIASNCSLAQDSPPGVRIAELQDQLESGLKARLPNEFEFIGRVVQSVKDRELSTGEVKSIFQWARRKNKIAPFPYFERAMRIIAAQKGITL